MLAALSILALAHCVSDDGGSGAVFVEGGAPPGATTYAVAGTVAGLPTQSTVTLTLNGMTALKVGNGPFAFADKLVTGQSYAVVASAPPQGTSCAVSQGAGTIGDASVSGVVVTCASNDAALSALTISAAPLSPAFSPATLAYTATTQVSAVFPPSLATTTVTATAHAPGATITIAGAAAKSGTPSAPVTLTPKMTAIDVTVTAADGKTTQHYAIAVTGYPSDYIKASNTQADEYFGASVALSADGTTLAVGAYYDPSNATGVGGNQGDTSAPGAGAVFVYVRSGGVWSRQAYLKASNTRSSANFGTTVALSADGNTLVVGSPYESSAATGVGGNQLDTTAPKAGAAYVFVRAGTTFTQQAYLKASNALTFNFFGGALALSSDGNTLAVGAVGEGSSATGINGNQADNSLSYAGAAYVFTRAAATWSQQAYVKASNTSGDAQFGSALALSQDGNTLAVGAPQEASNATGINGNQADTSSSAAGATYVFLRTGSAWAQQAYVKASNTEANAYFATGLALSSDGNTLAVGAEGEASNATGVGGNQVDKSASSSGAAYLFTRSGTTWTQATYVKASNTRRGARFGSAVALSADATRLAVGAPGDSSGATGVNGDQSDTSAVGAGAVYTFSRSGATWSQAAYVKASNTRLNAVFGGVFGVALAADGRTLAVGASGDSSNAKGIDGNGADTSAANAGAAYVF